MDGRAAAASRIHPTSQQTGVESAREIGIAVRQTNLLNSNQGACRTDEGTAAVGAGHGGVRERSGCDDAQRCPHRSLGFRIALFRVRHLHGKREQRNPLGVPGPAADKAQTGMTNSATEDLSKAWAFLSNQETDLSGPKIT